MAVLYLVFCTWLANRGSEESNTFNLIFTSTKLGVMLVIIIVSFIYFDPQNMQPFITEEHGLYGLVVGAVLVFFGYLGFDIITTLSEEAKNPKTDVPKSIVHSILYVMAIYITVSFSVSG